MPSPHPVKSPPRPLLVWVTVVCVVVSFAGVSWWRSTTDARFAHVVLLATRGDPVADSYGHQRALGGYLIARADEIEVDSASASKARIRLLGRNSIEIQVTAPDQATASRLANQITDDALQQRQLDGIAQTGGDYQAPITLVRSTASGQTAPNPIRAGGLAAATAALWGGIAVLVVGRAAR